MVDFHRRTAPPLQSMVAWVVKKYIRENGRCPLDKWLDSNAITKNDQAAFDARIELIEQVGGPELPPEVVKKYTDNLCELKIRGDKKQLRPLCIKEGKSVIIFCGALEKDSKIPEGDIETAENLLKEYRSGKGSVKIYNED